MSIELILGEGPALASESPGGTGTLPEDVWAGHARGDVAGRRMRIVEAGRKRTIVRARRRKRIVEAGRRKRRIVRAGRRRRIIGVVAGLNKSCQ